MENIMLTREIYQHFENSKIKNFKSFLKAKH